MPIVYHQLDPANAGQPGYAVAMELARQTVAQFGAVRWVGVGIAGGSCCAALALQPAPGVGFPAGHDLAGFGPAPIAGGFPAPIYGAPLPFAIAYGNSQLAAGGLDVGPLGGHAERAALTAAAGSALYTLPGSNDAVLFVELTCCGGCQGWLNGGGGGVPNPYNGLINGVGATTLHVWWRWEYPGPGLPPGMGGVALVGGVPAMNAFHGAALPLQLADINANW